MTDTSNHTRTLTALIAALPTLPMKEVWALWDAHFPRRPTHTNRNFIESRIAYRMQEKAYGALPAGVRRHLAACGATHSKIKTSERNGRGSEIHLMPGSTLVREWDDREYRVTVTPTGQYEIDGQTFKSLSAAARHITGTNWSGPKFFGLKTGPGGKA
jgi:hypothetical protein